MGMGINFFAWNFRLRSSHKANKGLVEFFNGK